MSTRLERRKIERRNGKYKKTLEGLVEMNCDNLDNIYKSCKKIADDFGVKYIPTPTLKVILNKAKLETNTEIKAVNTQNTQYNVTIDSLFDSCIKISKEMNTTNIPLDNIKRGINIIKDAYKKIIN